MTTQPLNVLVTGAYGLIGNLLVAHLAAQPERYNTFGLVKDTQRSKRSAAASSFYELPADHLRLADLSDLAAAQQAVTGMDVVVHLAGDPDSLSPWESILTNNIMGTHNLFEASRQARVRRVVYGSTNQVVFGYGAVDPFQPPTAHPTQLAESVPNPITHDLPTRPMNDYSASKVYGEALAHMYAHRFNLSCLCIRIGWVTSDNKVPGPRGQSLWCSHRDIVQILERAINAPDTLRFDVFFGHSDNLHNIVDIQHARDVLGYAPQDRAEDQFQ